MSLANLAIDVTVNSAQAQRGLRDVGATAREQFDRSGAAVDDFRRNLLAASDALAVAARSMGSGMDRAADEITAAAERGQDAVVSMGEAANDVKFDGLKNRLREAFDGAVEEAKGFGDKAMHVAEAGAKAVATAMAVRVATAAGATFVASAARIFVAYKAIAASYDFIKGLFTGDSYKNDSIDRLIARNKEQIEQQTAAKKKSFDMDVLVETSMRENGKELDRLGVKYQDANGKLLDHRQFLENVRASLEDYREGYDRVKAAQAIGIGSLDDVNAALADNSKALAEAAARNDEYQLGIGPMGQAEIARYQKAIREFNEEAQRTSDGFKHAIADSIMPVLTDLAEYFRDGWPFVVRAFRGSIATITSLFYGLKMAAQVALEGVRAAVQVVGELLVGVAGATVKAFKGDFTGAADDMKRAWQLSGAAVSQAMDEVAKDAEKNRDRMALAFGLDGYDAGAQQSTGRKGGKRWTPPPEAAAAVAAPKSPFKAYMEELDRMAVKVEQNEYASMRLKAAQLAQKEGVNDLAGAYEKIDRVQRGDSQKTITDHARALYESANAYEFETSLIGKNALEQEKLVAAYQQRQQAEQLVRAAQRSGRPLDQAALDDLDEITKRYIRQTQEQIDARDKLSRSFDVGVSSTLSNYVRAATDAAANVSTLISGSLTRIEDAFINWARTGKASVKDLFAFMAEEYLRQTFRMAAAKVVTGGVAGASNFLSDLGQVFGLGGFTLSNGIDYVPYNGYPATLHEGEKVLTRQEATAARSGAGGGPVFDFSGQVLNVGSGVSRSEFASAMQANNARLMSNLQRLRTTGAA